MYVYMYVFATFRYAGPVKLNAGLNGDRYRQ